MNEKWVTTCQRDIATQRRGPGGVRRSLGIPTPINAILVVVRDLSVLHRPHSNLHTSYLTIYILRSSSILLARVLYLARARERAHALLSRQVGRGSVDSRV